jgi:DNA-binding Xre family transcriptional regulator
MIKSKFEKLRREKSARENRDLPMRVIAAETGLALGTVQRLNKGDMERVYLSTLDKLCGYFKVKEIGELIEYEVPNE